jgi:dTDP-4-amino-4,6-dideoxygalactose transaminase
VDVAPEAAIDRDALMAALAANGVGSGVHYRGVHLHPYYRDRYGLAPEDFPVATDRSHRTLSLPLSPAVTEKDQDDVARTLRAAASRPVSRA